MNIITCIKQVPGTTEVEVDPKTGVLKRDSQHVKMNPYDLYALEASFVMKSMTEDGIVHAISMGPPGALSVLQEALYMGADKATLISDMRFAGADVLATSHTLSQLIGHLAPYDVIICGKQTTDGDTAQVGPEIAELLGIPHVPYVKEIIAVNHGGIVVKSGYEHHDETVEVTYPVLLTVDKGVNVPRLPSFKRKQVMKNYQIQIASLKDLEDQDPAHYGLTGSPTQVEEIFPPSKTTESETLKGDAEQLAKALHNLLKDRKFL